ncbi:MAG: transglycosylase SLT domain-containing protein [Muribaculaceae bacterium]|nr:transglycosylase SLT domain-containing protein [Muribaculaceae bacterium]
MTIISAPRRGLSALGVVVLLMATMLAGCRHKASDLIRQIDTVKVVEVHFDMPDTLRVGTLYSPTSYFIYREVEMGYDYDMISNFAADKGVPLKLEIATSLASAIEMLDSGKIDMIAYEVPITAEYKDGLVYCGAERITSQVLVQPKSKDGSRIDDVTELIGRDVYVEKDSKYQHRLVNLNDELGGGIKIHAVDRDTLITEDLIQMVSDGTIPLTVVDSDVAALNKTYYNDLDITLEVSFPQRASWAVAPSISWLADTINAWSRMELPSKARAQSLKRYFELSKNSVDQPSSSYSFTIPKGHLSPFDHLFKRHAKLINWDWRLLAAQGYVESKFDSTVVSWAGARGIMQIMPKTARAFGLSGDLIVNNDANIATAAKIIRDLDKTFRNRVPDHNERLKFIIAAYNSGPAHILDAIALAEKHGLNPRVWDDNVAQALLMKSKPEYYNDPVCRYGYFRGRQTFEYVNKVFSYYNTARSKVSQ